MIDLPPPRFDHPYPGVVVETVLTLAEIREFCHGGPDVMACVPFAPNFPGDKCFVYLPKVGPGGVSQRTQDLLRRHERGHCNKWTAAHEK